MLRVCLILCAPCVLNLFISMMNNFRSGLRFRCWLSAFQVQQHPVGRLAASRLVSAVPAAFPAAEPPPLLLLLLTMTIINRSKWSDGMQAVACAGSACSGDWRWIGTGPMKLFFLYVCRFHLRSYNVSRALRNQACPPSSLLPWAATLSRRTDSRKISLYGYTN